MRLLRAADLSFHEYEGSFIPPYAILSHRWEGEEITYQEFKDRTAATKSKTGFKKIQQCCHQALEDRIKFVWVDTCCIDKSSSAELSEAINSMYAWYQRSEVCYAYLSDVHTWSTYEPLDANGAWVNVPEFTIGLLTWKTPIPQFIMHVMKSKWWTRGWTLQELIAPDSVVFYVNGLNGWSNIGTKRSLLNLVAARTGIEKNILRDQDVRSCSVAQRMSWASERQTTRTEDLAYCLLGIFGVNMPLLYGEGTKAFLRLQEEIMKQSDDQTLFAWQLGYENTKDDICGPLAPHPSKFRRAGNLLPVSDADFQSPYSMTNKGLRIELPIEHQGDDAYGMATLHCGTYSTFPRQLGLPVVRLGPPGTNHYARDARYVGPLVAITVKERTSKVVFMKQEPGLRVERRLELLANISQDTLASFPTVCCSTLVTETDLQSTTGYKFPASCRRGAILMSGRDYSNLLVLFNIEMQHIGRYACKVIYTGVDWERTLSQEQLHYLALKVHDAGQKEATLAGEVDQGPIGSLLHGDYGLSNSRSSFAYLPQDRVAFAKITLHDALDSKYGSNLVLHVHIQDHSEGPQEPYELWGGSAVLAAYRLKKKPRLLNLLSSPAYSVSTSSLITTL